MKYKHNDNLNNTVFILLQILEKIIQLCLP